MESQNLKKRHYVAFISYSHQDNRVRREGDTEQSPLPPKRIEWGDWLHKELERFTVPAGYRGKLNARGERIPGHLRPIFRDELEIPTASSLQDTIEQALTDSDYLIVICSPRSARSQYVNAEVEMFKRLGRTNQIFPIIIDGEPNAADKAEIADDRECFCPALKHPLDSVGPDGQLDYTRRAEPICADIRWGESKSEIDKSSWGSTKDVRQMGLLKLIAGVRGVGFDDLWNREKRRQRRRMAGWVSSAFVAIAVFAGLAYLKQLEAEEQRIVAEIQRESAEKQKQKAFIAAGEGFLLRARIHETSSDSAFYAARAIGFEGFGKASPQTPPENLSPRGVRSDLRTTWNRLTRGILPVSAMAIVEEEPYPRFLAPQFALTKSNQATSIVNLAMSHPFLWSVTVDSQYSYYVTSVAWSPDASTVAAGSMDRVTLWDLQTGEEKATLTGHSDLVTSVAWSPDGNTLASGSSDGTVKLWDVQSGKEKTSLAGHFGQVFSVAWSPDGSTLATGSNDKTVKLWDVASGTEKAP